jgi:hypothetical protein
MAADHTRSPFPALDELRDRLVANGVNVEVLRVASALLDLVHQQAGDPHAVILWIEQLAIDVTKLRQMFKALDQRPLIPPSP